MLCKLGCGLKSSFQRKNGNFYCADHNSKCPAVRQKISDKNSANQKGKTHSDATKKKMSEARKGRIFSQETIDKIKKSNKDYWSKNKRIPWNKGKQGLQIPWNKGLKKTESAEILERDDPIYRNFGKYRNRVSTRTKKNYDLYKEQINPNNLMLGKAGVDGAHHIDHILSVREGFEKGISVEQIADASNLQVIPWLDNIRKYDGKGKRKNSI